MGGYFIKPSDAQKFLKWIRKMDNYLNYRDFLIAKSHELLLEVNINDI